MAEARLIWTAPALDALDEIVSWIALDDEPAAERLARRVMSAIGRLRRFPDSGRWVPEVPGRIYREVIVPPCRNLYRREGAAVLIVHIQRGEQQLRPEHLR